MRKQTYIYSHRLPKDIVNWSIIRPSRLDAANALNEWKAMIKEWPIDPDG